MSVPGLEDSQLPSWSLEDLSCHIRSLTPIPLAREAAWKGYINRERKVQLIQTGIWIKSPWTLQTSQLRAEYPVGITWSRKKSVNQAFPRFLIHKIKLYNIFFSILRQKFKKQKEEREIKKKGGTYLQLKIISLYIP